MYNLFMEKCNENQSIGVSMITYRRIFGTEYNMSFFKPKKDQCSTCNEYQKASTEEKLSLKLKYKEHLQRKEASMKNKEEDKKRAASDKSFKSITCDMQSVLQIPISQLCENNIIPSPLHAWYRSLPSSCSIQDVTAEPSENDPDEEEENY
ncbi:unnamed protein product [Psylliodes chrysocephalus]|uniref:Uncharacterized protein n=1 Tax=Psylliodes chrysocephalus TaxID=3402493 RepID=A0A9P0CYR9_9CUCU|nr:unnamed protein product [Psylliodes chrysocephala]